MKVGQIALEKVLEKNLATYKEIEGCTEEDIELVMKAQNVTTLPEIYKDFLLTLGRKAGNLWHNAVYTIASLYNLKNSALRLLEQNGNPISLPADAFVFYMEDGILFYYFLTSHSVEDPSIYEYLEVEYSHGELSYPLSDFLINVY